MTAKAETSLIQKAKKNHLLYMIYMISWSFFSKNDENNFKLSMIEKTYKGFKKEVLYEFTKNQLALLVLKMQFVHKQLHVQSADPHLIASI